MQSSYILQHQILSQLFKLYLIGNWIVKDSNFGFTNWNFFLDILQKRYLFRTVYTYPHFRAYSKLF